MGKKQFAMITNQDGKKEMRSRCMLSSYDACKRAGVKGIGTIEDILHIMYAVKNGIKSIPRYSYAKSTLFHLKMGFTPVQELWQINSLYDVEKFMKEMVDYSAMDIAPQNYTPIIVFKDGKYYLDKNTTQCIANLRQIKQNYDNGLGDSVRPFIRGQGVEMELTGKNYDIWKRIIETLF